ncbi:MAG: glycosyltransferase family 2 protein [Anaerolineae bacterium]|nr:glycosyltransferase family 2 protein [Anaerolineae bacterium]
MNQIRVLVIILNWQQPEITIECVQSVRAMYTSGVDVLVVDNGSGDDSITQLQILPPDVSLLALPENLGFAGGVNCGLRQAMQAGYDYALLLNNDAFPAPDMLDSLLAETANDIALLCPKIFYEMAPTRIWFAGGRQDRRLLEMRDTGRGEPDSPAWSGSRDVDYLVGTGLLVNVTAVAHAGLLDEHFFMYYEDLDWSIRLRQAGYRLRFVGAAHLYHRVSLSSGGENSPLHRYYLARSSVIFFSRHARAGCVGAIVLFRLGSAVKIVAQLLLAGKATVARAYLRGLYDGWQMQRKMV